MQQRWMSIIIFWITLLFPLTLTANLHSSHTNSACDHLLIAPLLELAQLRSEILLANKIDQKLSDRESAWASNIISGRAIDFDSTLARGTHIISLGSGPDIFLPLYEFPTAQYFHLVDLLTGWGRGPEDVLSEIQYRLRAIAPDAKVAQMDMNLVSDPTLAALYAVRWTSPSQGLITKYFYVHRIDFRDAVLIQVLLNSIHAFSNNNQIGGLVMTGMTAPYTTLATILRKLIHGGIFYTEMKYINSDGVVFDPESTETLAKLSEGYQINEYPMEAKELKQGGNVPTRYVIRKP